MFWWDFFYCVVAGGGKMLFFFFNVPVHVAMINANYLDPQSIFLFYVFYDVNCEWAIFFICFPPRYLC